MRGKPRLRSLQPIRIHPRPLRPDHAVRIATSVSAFGLLLPRFIHAEVEELHVVSLDPDLAVKGIELVARGSVDHVEVEVREVFVSAVRERASYVLLAHNHPACSANPSQADRDLTERLIVAGQVLGIPVLDHLVLGEAASYVSFADERLMACPIRGYPIPF